MHSVGKRVFFADYVFDVWENVYEPAEDSFLFAENLVVREGDFVLDVGTGCGILGIIAAEKADRVVTVDINPHAVRCAKENAKLNCVAEKMLFICGDLFASLKVKERFDLVLFNSPYLPVTAGEEESWIGHAWAGGESGRRVICRFIREVPRHVGDGGRVLLMQSTLSDVDETVRRFEENGLRVSIIARCDLSFFETLVLVTAER